MLDRDIDRALALLDRNLERMLAEFNTGRSTIKARDLDRAARQVKKAREAGAALMTAVCKAHNIMAGDA